MSASQKHDHFVQFPMGEHPVTILPGIGYGNKKGLRINGYKKARQVFGQFLVLNMSEREFKDWLWRTCGADVKSQTACYNGLKEWYKRNFDKSFV